MVHNAVPAGKMRGMFVQSKAKTPEEYIALLDEPRKSEIARIDAFIRKTVPKLKPHICMGILGYGSYHYKCASGREGNSARIAVANNKQNISMYVSCGSDGRGALAERFKKTLPKASIGKCCIRFKKFDDLDPVAVKDLLKAAARNQ